MVAGSADRDIRMEGIFVKPLIFQSDFGYADGAVSAMYGVAENVCGNLRMYDLTHDIRPYDIWEASYRLIQTVGYWPGGSVFVSVVDPGVGPTRRSIAAETAGGQFIVTPDNGTLTHVKRIAGLVAAREIDEVVNRLPGSVDSYTFHGRDIYAYTGARLAAGILAFSDIGPEVDTDTVTQLPILEALRRDADVMGTIDVLDVRFGSLWTNIPKSLFDTLHIGFGEYVEVIICNETRTLYRNFLSYQKSFADVNVGEPLVYANSLDYMAVAINQGSFANAYNIGTGNSWHISMRKGPRLVYE